MCLRCRLRIAEYAPPASATTTPMMASTKKACTSQPTTIKPIQMTTSAPITLRNVDIDTASPPKHPVKLLVWKRSGRALGSQPSQVGPGSHGIPGQPLPEPAQRRADVVGGAREGQPDELAATVRIKVVAGCDGDPGVREQPQAPGHRVAGQRADVRVGVEG